MKAGRIITRIARTGWGFAQADRDPVSEVSRVRRAKPLDFFAGLLHAVENGI